jgi:hypothetical protein
VTNGDVELDWADGKHTFNVAKFEQAFELEEKCSGSGLHEIFERITARRWRVTDIRETIRIGLIGGGAKPAEALKLVRRYVEGRPWAESVPFARIILLAALVGVEGDNDLGKDPAGPTGSEAGQPALSDPPSTE